MSLHIDTLYHWSPADKRVSILKEGLKVYSQATSHEGYAYPYICLATSPSSGWGLSGDMDWAGDIEEWDLWQVRILDGDDIRIRSDFGPVIREVRVFSSLPPDRLWFVGTREPHSAVEIRKSTTRSRRRKKG